MQIDHSGKRVLVTGGDTGLGEATVRAFAASGAKVGINYIGEAAPAQALADEITGKGGSARAFDADISDPAAVAAMFADFDQAFGGIDVLVANAGIDGKKGLAWEIDIESWRRVIDVNLVGTFLCAREALKRMVPQKSGVIVNTSSVHQVIAWSGYSAYTASKAGVAMMANTMAQEAAPSGVRIVCIAPGAIETPINANVWQDPAGYRDLLDKIPMRRVGKPEDIAGMAVFLASEAAAYVTATTVFVDGGMTDYPSFMHGG